MIVDTSALLAFFDTDEPDHAAVSGVLARASEPLVVSPYVVAELDYLVASRLGGPAEAGERGRRHPARHGKAPPRGTSGHGLSD